MVEGPEPKKSKPNPTDAATSDDDNELSVELMAMEHYRAYCEAMHSVEDDDDDDDDEVVVLEVDGEEDLGNGDISEEIMKVMDSSDIDRGEGGRDEKDDNHSEFAVTGDGQDDENEDEDHIVHLNEVLNLLAPDEKSDNTDDDEDITQRRSYLEIITPEAVTKAFRGDHKSMVPVLCSMAYLHLALAEGDSSSSSSPLPSPLLLKKALRQWKYNAGAQAMLANHWHNNPGDCSKNTGEITLEEVRDLYEAAATNASAIRKGAIAIVSSSSTHDDKSIEDTEGSVDLSQEWAEALLLDGVVGVEYLGDDLFSCSEVESTARFMASMIGSTLGDRDEKVLAHLKKFRVTHRLHPSVWRDAPSLSTTTVLDTTKKELPLCIQGNVLPRPLFDAMLRAFRPDAPYWDESDYDSRGYYSFWMDLSSCNPTKKDNNLVEEVIRNHLMPLVQPFVAAQQKDQQIVGAEWWTHTRPVGSNLGHQLHFDTDESTLASSKEVCHPAVSVVLYLTCPEGLAGPTLVMEQTPDSKKVAELAHVGVGVPNSLLLFSGDRLHGVLPCRRSSLTTLSQPQPHRLTFMVGFWTRQVVSASTSLPSKGSAEDCKDGTIVKDDETLYYGPCGPFPAHHEWTSDLVLDKDSLNLPRTPEADLSYRKLPTVSPVWESIQYDDDIKSDDDIDPPLILPPIMDHRFFVHGAPSCFRDSLFRDE